MSDFKLILSGISIAIIAFIAIRIGITGLKTNIKSDKLIHVSWKNMVKDPVFYIDKYVQIDCVYTYNHRLEISGENRKSVSFITSLADDHYDSLVILQRKLRFFIKTNGILEHSFEKNPTGIVRNLSNELGSEAMHVLESGDEEILADAILIDTLEKPRKWYWNVLLILIPLTFILLFAKAIYIKVKSKTFKK